jgi:hypothetical protein
VNIILLYDNLRDVTPVKTGIQIASGPEGKNWIPDQVRNDKMRKVIYETLYYLEEKAINQDSKVPEIESRRSRLQPSGRIGR